jgi:hypothetical protein
LPDEAVTELKQLSFDSLLIGKQWNTTITNIKDGSKPANRSKKGRSLRENGKKKSPKALGKTKIINQNTA